MIYRHLLTTGLFLLLVATIFLRSDCIAAFYYNLGDVALVRWLAADHQTLRQRWNETQASLRFFARAQTQIPDYGEVKQRMNRLLLLSYPETSSKAMEYFRQGLLHEQVGELEEAIQSCEQALSQNRRLIPAYVRLGQLYESQGRLVQAKKTLKEFTRLDPEYQVSKTINDKWTLIGYELDEDALAWGLPVPITLYWRLEKGIAVRQPVHEKQGEWDLYRYGRRVYQLGTVANLAPNGGFERADAPHVGTPTRHVGTPYGYDRYPYNAPPEQHAITIAERNGQKTLVATLYNLSKKRSSLQTQPIPVRDDVAYLAAAWVRNRASGGIAGVGCWWVGDLPHVVAPYDHDFIEAGTEQWSYLSHLTRPIPGARACRLWLFNYEGSGHVDFDDALFMALEPPR